MLAAVGAALVNAVMRQQEILQHRVCGLVVWQNGIITFLRRRIAHRQVKLCSLLSLLEYYNHAVSMCERVKGGNNLLYCNYLICSDDILIQISKGFWVIKFQLTANTPKV